MVTIEQIKTLINGVVQKIPPFVKPNWDENDEKSPHYIKGRTHWTDAKGRVHRLPTKYMPVSMPSSYRDEVQLLVNSGVSSANSYSDAQNKNLKCDWNNGYSGTVEFIGRPFGYVGGTNDANKTNAGIGVHHEWNHICGNVLGAELVWRQTPWTVQSHNVEYYYYYDPEDGSGELKNRHMTANFDYNNCTILRSRTCGSFVLVGSFSVYDANGYSLGTIRTPYFAFVAKTGNLKFYSKDAADDAECEYEFDFCRRGIFLVNLRNDGNDTFAENVGILPEHGLLNVTSVNASEYSTLLLQSLSPENLPVIVKPLYLNNVYDSMEVGSYTKVPISALEWMTSMWDVAPTYLLLDNEILAKVTYHNYGTDEVVDLQDCTRANYRIEFSGGTVIDYEGKKAYKHIEGMLLSCDDDDIWDWSGPGATSKSRTQPIARFFLIKREIIPLGIPNCSADDEGKILKVVNGVPTWVDAGALEFID